MSEPKHISQERREFIRVRHECPVAYGFVGPDVEEYAGQTHEGKTNNLSGGGLKLLGRLPNPDWIPGMLSRRIAVGVRISLPDGDPPVEALTRTAWLEVRDRKSRTFLMGLRFTDISSTDRERIIQFIIGSQMR